MGRLVIAEPMQSLEERFCDLTQNSCVNCQNNLDNKSFATDAQTDKKNVKSSIDEKKISISRWFQKLNKS